MKTTICTIYFRIKVFLIHLKGNYIKAWQRRFPRTWWERWDQKYENVIWNIVTCPMIPYDMSTLDSGITRAFASLKFLTSPIHIIFCLRTTSTILFLCFWSCSI